MTQQKRPSINLGGKIYDAETGELLRVVKPQLDIIPRQVSIKPTKHRQKPSQTLNRDFVKAPVVPHKTPAPTIKKRAYSAPAATQKPTRLKLRQGNFRNRQIKHFASLEDIQQTRPRKPVVLSETINPPEIISHTANQQFKQTIAEARQTDFLTRYRMKQIARQRRAKELETIRQLKASYRQQSSLPQLSAAEQQAQNRAVKNLVLARALANSPSSTELAKQSPVARPNFFKRHASLLVVTLLTVLLGAYLTYLNLPNISIYFAASRAGINAKYPDYQPSGYTISKLPTANDHQVVMEYHNGDKTLTLTQQASSLDSKTTLENIVKKHAGEMYATDQTKGLTIYTYDGQATWINGGILYNLAYHPSLSLDQINKIATSL